MSNLWKMEERMVKFYGMVNYIRRNMEIDQNKTCQLLGQMRTGHSCNMEMESHILGTPEIRG